MQLHEDEYPLEDLQLSEIRMAQRRGRSKDSQRSCETYRKNAGVELKFWFKSYISQNRSL